MQGHAVVIYHLDRLEGDGQDQHDLREQKRLIIKSKPERMLSLTNSVIPSSVSPLFLHPQPRHVPPGLVDSTEADYRYQRGRAKCHGWIPTAGGQIAVGGLLLLEGTELSVVGGLPLLEGRGLRVVGGFPG